MIAPVHIRVVSLDDAARAELGDRVVFEIAVENVGLHWRHRLGAHIVILDAFDRHWAITRRAAAA